MTFTDKAAGGMRARLDVLGVERVRAVTFHRRRARAALVLGKVPNLNHLLEGAAAPRDRQLAADAVRVHGRGRSRDRGRVGEEPPVDAQDVPRRPSTSTSRRSRRS